MKFAEDIIIKPYITEKSNEEMMVGKYTFIVAVDATKLAIKSSIEKLFGVKILKVNTMNYTGKEKRMGVHLGRRSDWKKAIIKIDQDPNGEKEKKVKVKNEEGKVVTEVKKYYPGSYYEKKGNFVKSSKKYKTSIEEFGVAQ
ncbi:MAG: 50S ribosomal protein L23 [Clostridiales bacterium]